MTPKPVIPRELANRDVTQAIGYYLKEGSVQAALGFIDALERAYTQISHHPASGSLRYAQELSIPGLRVLKLAGCPQLVFYLERGNYIDVWRVLHGQRDIPTWMQAPEEP